MTPLRIDMSSLAAFSMCKRRGVLNGLHRLKSVNESIYLTAGKAIHLAIETRYKGGTDAEALAAFDADYKPYSDKVVYEDNPRRWENLRKILEVWLARFPSHPYTIPGPEFVEVGFSLPLTPWLTIVGKPDALVKFNNAWWVLDTKTTAKMDYRFRDKWNHSGQISCYIHALSEHLKARGDTTPVAGAIINAIEIKEIPESKGACRNSPPHAHPNGEKKLYAECGAEHLQQELILAHRTPNQIQDWVNGVIAEAKDYAKAIRLWPSLGDVPSVPANGIMNDACGLCQYREWCFGNRSPKMLEVMYDRNDWEPFPGALWAPKPLEV